MNRLPFQIFKVFLALILTYETQTLSSILAASQQKELLTQIPKHLGIIEKVYPGNSEKVVYLLRDLHAHEEAQRKEISILKWLQRKTKLEWIFTEGAEGPLSTALLKTLSSDPIFQKKLLDDFLASGALTASEYLSIMEPDLWKIRGIERSDMYWINVDAFRKTQQMGENTVERIFKNTQKKLNRSFRENAPLRLTHFYKTKFKLDQNKISLKKYCEVLLETASSVGLKKPSYPQLHIMQRLSALESKLKDGILEKEFHARLEEKIKSKSSSETKKWIHIILAYRIGKISQADYINQIQPLIDPDEKKHFAPYFEILKQQGALNLTKLQSQLKQLEKNIEKSLLWSSGLYQLRFISERFDLLRKLCALQLSAQEWKQMKNWNLERTLREISQWREEKFLSLSDLQILKVRIQSAVKFYTSAQERDQLLAENSLKWIEKQKLDQAAVIVGGFHSDDLAKKLAKEGITVVVMTPRIQSATDHTKYFEIMSGKKSLLDRILGDPRQDAFNAEIKIQLHLPFSSIPAQGVMPPLRLARAHAALRNALEEKALFLTFLNFLYFEAKGPSFLREIERFKDELKKSYIKNLEEELEENEIPPADRTGLIENAILHLNRFFKTLNIQNVDKKGSILKVQGRFGEEGFEIDILQDPLAEIPTSLRDAAETGELKEGAQWFLKPYGVQDPHWLEVKEVIGQDNLDFADIPQDLNQRIWSQDSVSLEAIKNHNPELFKGYNPNLFKGVPNVETKEITPVISIEEKDGNKIYRVVAGGKTLRRQSQNQQYYVNAWIGKTPKPEDRIVDEYQAWEKSRFSIGSFDSSIKARIEKLFGLLEESQTVSDSDEFLYTLFRKTVFSDIPPDVQEVIIESLGKMSWVSDWTTLEKIARGYRSESVKTAVREAQLFVKKDNQIHWGNLRNLAFSRSHIHHSVAWELMKASVLKPLSLHYLRSSDAFKREEAVRALSSLDIDKEILFNVLKNDDHFRVADVAGDFLVQLGDKILSDIENLWDTSRPVLIERLATTLLKIKTPKSLEMFCGLYFKLPEDLKPSLIKFFTWKSLSNELIFSLWGTDHDDFPINQKQELLNALNLIASENILGPLLYFANSEEPLIRERARKILSEKPELNTFLGETTIESWSPTVRFLKDEGRLDKLGSALKSLSFYEENYKKLLEQFIQEPQKTLLDHALSEEREIAFTATELLDKLEVKGKTLFKRFLPELDLQPLMNLIPDLSLSLTDVLEIKFFLKQRGDKAFYKAIQQLKDLKNRLKPDALKKLIERVGVGTMLRIEGFEEYVEIKINSNLTLEVHPGIVERLKNTLGAQVSQRTVVFNSLRLAESTAEDMKDMKEKALIFRQFNEANFQVIGHFEQGDWSEKGFKTSKNRAFQAFHEMLRHHETLYPQDPEIPKIRLKANRLNEEIDEMIKQKKYDKSMLMDVGPYQSLDQISTLHGLLRYLHGKGGYQLFDVLKVQLKASKKVSAVSSYMVDLNGDVLDQVQHPILLVSEFNPKKGYPEALKYFMRNMLHAINPLHSPENQKALKKLVEEHDLLEDLHLNFSSPHVQAMIFENEIVAYFAMGLHTSELWANLTHPNQGGLVQFRWNEGEWKRDIQGAWRERLYLIRKMLAHLGVQTDINDWQLRARFDKETGARSISDILKVAGTILRTHASFRYLDLPLGLTGLKDKELSDYLDYLSQFLNRMGKVEFYKAALGVPMAEKVEALEKHEDELRIILNKILTDLGLETIPEEDSKPFGQVAINRYFNKKIEEGHRNKILVMNSEGQVQKDSTLKEIKQVPQMVDLLSNEKEWQNMLRMGALIRTLAPDLKFTSIGTINGYLVERAHLDTLGRFLTLIVLRNHQGEILTGFAAFGSELFSRRQKEATVTNLIRKPELLAKILRRNGFPIHEASYKLSDDDQERALQDLQRIKIRPLPVQGKILPGYATPGIGISTGLAVGKVKLDLDNLNPVDLHDNIWIVPFALPDHASKIRKSRATVMTGGARLTHAGMLVREARRPGIIVNGTWVYNKGEDPVEVHIPYETFERVFEEAGEFQITRRRNIEQHVAVLQNEDVILVDGDGEIYSFPPELQEKTRQVLALTSKIKSGKDVFSLYPLTRLLRETPSHDLTQLAVFDLFLNNPELSPYEKKEFLRIFSLNLPTDRRSFVQQYLNDYLTAKRRTVTNTLHDIKARVPEVRQPIELEYLLSRALNTVEDFQNVQIMIGHSARVYRSSLSEILDLTQKRVDVLKQETDWLSWAGPEWLMNPRAVEKAKKLGSISEEMIANAKGWFKKWLDDQREKLKGQIVYPISSGVQKALAFMVDRIGAKAAKLAEIAGLVPVPKGFVIDVDAYNQFLTENNLVSQIHTIISSELSSAEKSKQIQDLIYTAPIPKNLEEKFLQEFRNLNADAVAVRSSSTAEDMDTASFAGQMETTLNVQGEEAFLTAVKRSWASLWTQRAIEYRKDYDIPLEVGQAVFVQTMIDSQVSGVISTMNVLSNDWSEMVVNSGWGLGSGPIEGKTNSDQFILDMKTGRLKEELIARKTTEYTKESGNNPVSVSPNRVFAKTLTPDKLSTLHRYAKVLEDYYGFPLDIEFAIDRIGMIHIVQVRPITTVDIRNDIHLGDLSFLHRKVLDNFADNLWHEFQSLVENATNGLDSLRTLQSLFKRQLYANANYKGYMYILVNVLQRWLNEYGTPKDVDALAPDIYVIADELKQKPFEAQPLEHLQTAFPNEFKRLENYLVPFIHQKPSKDVGKLSEIERMQVLQGPELSNRYAEIHMENIEEASFVNNALDILESGRSLILEGEYEWVKDHFYLLAEQLHFDGKREWIDRILVSPSSLKQGPKIFSRLYTEEPLIQLSEILPLAFHNGSLVRLAGLNDATVITKLNNEMAHKLGEPERPLEYFQQLLSDNPLTLVGVDKSGKIKGTLFLGLIRSEGLDNIPENYQGMIHSHQDSEDVNTMVDFWIIGMPELIPISKYLASKWGLEHLFAYSRPSRAGTLLYELAKADQPDLDFNELMNTVVRKIDVKDRLVTYFDRLNAKKLLGIQVDYDTDEGLDHFMGLYLVKHLLLASRDPVEEAISDRRPFLKWMTKHQDELTGEFGWFNFDKVWNYLHNDELDFDSETDALLFARKVKPVVQKFLKDTGRWTLESVLWKLHIKAEMRAVFPASRSDGTYQDLWSNVIMSYPIRPNYISAPPVKTESLRSPTGQSFLERAA